MTFPLPTVATTAEFFPADFHGAGILDRNYIFHVGDVVTLGCQQFFGFVWGTTTTPNAYTVKDYFGNVVSTGTISGSTVELTPSAAFTTFTVTPPGGGFIPGWYDVTITGPTHDATYNFNYGTTSFVVIKNTPGFHQNVTPNPVTDPGSEHRDVVVKAAMGMGVSRLQIGSLPIVNPASPGAGGSDSLQACIDGANAIRTYQPSDPARPWPIWCQFNLGSVDSWFLPVDAGGQIFVKTPGIDGSKVFISTGPGTTSGMKLRVAFPDATTIIETYDNLTTAAAANTAINAGSAYVKAFLGAVSAATNAPTAIGNSYRAGTIATVQTLYPLGVTHYEGPSNEPGVGANVAHQLRLMTDAVHTGNPAAIAMGPCNVSINPPSFAGWQAFFDECVAESFVPDAIATHMYGANPNGDINSGRNNFDQWFDLLARNGMGGKEVWSTESTNGGTIGYGKHYPRVAKTVLMEVLQMEQYGIPRERNLVWYDQSHGFWSAPSFMENGDGSLHPYVLMFRTLAEETFGKLHHHPIDFGCVQGNRTFIGSVYLSASDGTSTAWIASGSKMPAGSTITFSVVGTASSLTVVDCFGNLTTATVSSNLVSVPIAETPTFLRIPAGVALYVHSCLDWGASPPPTASQYARATFSGTTPAPAVTDNAYLTEYTGQGAGFAVSPVTTMPDTCEILFNSNVTTHHVLIWAALPIQAYGTLADFDVQTTADGGSTWTTRATITETDLAAVNSAVNGSNTGTTWKSFWTPRWFFNANLGSSLVINGVRLNVRATSYGEDPIPDINAVFGNASAVQQICLQEVAVISATTPNPFTAAYADLVAAEASLVASWRFNDTVVTNGATAASSVNTVAVGGSYFGGNFKKVTGPAADNATAAQTTAGACGFSSATNTPGSPLDVGDTFTYECWRNSGGTLNDGSFISFYAGATQHHIGFSSTAITLDSVAHTSTGPFDASWHHFVVTKNGATTKLYIDGVDLTVAGTNTTFATGGNTQIVLSPGTAAPIGFANLNVYSTALSAATVKALYYAATIPAAPPTLDPNFAFPNPVITGTNTVGGQLQCSTGIWVGAPTAFGYQWMNSTDGVSGWADCPGGALAQRSDYIPVSADHGLFLSCLVTAGNITGTGTPARSAVTGSGTTGGGGGGGGGSPTSFYLDQEDGTSLFTLEEGGGSILLEDSGPVGPPLSVGEHVGHVPIF